MSSLPVSRLRQRIQKIRRGAVSQKDFHPPFIAFVLSYDSFVTVRCLCPMVERPVGFDASRSEHVYTWVRARGRRLASQLRRGRLAPWQAWTIVGFVTVAVGQYFWRSEGIPSNILFTAAVTAGIASVLALTSRRLMFSAVATAAFVLFLVTAATIKRERMDAVVHAYDLVFYLSSWSTVSFLWSDFRGYVLGFFAGLAAMAALSWFAYRIDPLRVRRTHAALALVIATALTWAGAELKGERRHMQFFFSNLLVSSFYASWGETVETLWRGQLVEAAARANGPPFALPQDCRMDTRPPHVILIHQESVVPPGIFAGLSYDKSLDSLFQSQDGQTHKLRVETYGGASWLTEFSILAGISTHSFGGMRQFVQSVMENRIRDTLPQALARCGYRNVVFYPMLKNFVSNARFYQSVGLKEIFDLKDQGATKVNERDRFYYTNALNEMARHVKASDAGGGAQPLFTFIQTMATHWPYDTIYSPDVAVPGGGPGTHPEISEYLRRLAMAKMDYGYLKEELARRFPHEQFLIVHYGDHQPTPTRLLLGFKEEADAEDVVLDPNSLGMQTYYAVDGINYQVPPLPAHDIVDVPYLGMITLAAARLPLSEAQLERKRLLEACGGRYYTCPRRQEILAFHRRLITSGIMDAR